MNEHPSVDIIGSEGSELAGKVIILCVTGSVAAVRSSDVARKLIRHGAEVWPVMTRSACEIIHPNLLEWATGHRPILELTGGIEHVALAGNVPVKADLVLVAPATANTIGKVAAGIDDTPVTTFITTAFGEGIPLVMVPAMHQSMYAHPFVLENLAKLEGSGVTILMPRVEEGKAKIAGEEAIYQAVLQRLIPEGPLSRLRGQLVVITAGRTVEYLDPIRVVTNNSSGKMGLALAKAAHQMGARVVVVAGKLSVPLPSGITVVRAETAEEMSVALQNLLAKESPRVVIAAAAVGDWKPLHASSEKIPTSGGKLTVEFVPTPKILDQIKLWSPNSFVVAFRAQSGLTDSELVEDAAARLTKSGADLIAANDTARPGQGFETETNALTIVDKRGAASQIPLASKEIVAKKLLAIICERL